MPRTAFRLLVTVALLLAPSIAFAHPGHGGDTSLLAGFIHPFGGLDHLLAMTAVGLFAAHLGGRALWAVPTTFVARDGARRQFPAPPAFRCPSLRPPSRCRLLFSGL